VGNRQAADVPNSRDAIPILPPNKGSPSIRKKFNFKDKVRHTAGLELVWAAMFG
jgi:hypothetical protein